MRAPETTTVDGTPPPQVRFHELERRGSTVIDCLSEFIDNSIDAGSKIVTISTSSENGVRSISIEDDGCGCPNVGEMFGPESQKKGRNGQIGEFNVGMKHAALYLGKMTSRLDVETSDGLVGWGISIEWMTQGYGFESSDLSGKHRQPGTLVRISGRDIRKFKNAAEYRDRLGYRYEWPIRSGLRLLLSGKIVEPPSPPIPKPGCQCIEGQVFQGEQMRASYKAHRVIGSRCGVDVVYRGRTIETGQYLGVDSVDGMYCRVDLIGDGWEIDAHKIGFDEDQRQSLHDDLVPIMKPIVDDAMDDHDNIVDPGFLDELSDLANGRDGRNLKKQKRCKGSSKGSNGRNGGSRVIKTSEVQDGDGNAESGDGKKPKEWRVRVRKHEKHPTGVLRVVKSSRVMELNTACDLTRILIHKRSRLKDILPTALAHWTTEGEQQGFKQQEWGFGHRLYQLHAHRFGLESD